jgi:hypothetical protein
VRSRRVQISLGIGVAVVAVVVVLLLTRPSAEGPYALTAWDYGAIAWVEPVPEDLGSAALRASELFADTFTLWGFPPPEVVAERRVARKADPAGGRPVDLHALRWHGALLPSLVVVVFPDEEALAEATGVREDPVTLTYGVPPQPVLMAADQTSVEAVDWLADLTGASIAFACTAERWEERFVEAVAGWMLERALEISEICECNITYGMPGLVLGGIGGFTASRLLGGVDRIAVAKEYAVSHEFPTAADTDPLVFDVDAETRLALGTSFIAYLVEEHGTDGLVAAICDWYIPAGRGYCSRSSSRTLVYLKGWRAFLGLDPE